MNKTKLYSDWALIALICCLALTSLFVIAKFNLMAIFFCGLSIFCWFLVITFLKQEDQDFDGILWVDQTYSNTNPDLYVDLDITIRELKDKNKVSFHIQFIKPFNKASKQEQRSKEKQRL